MISAASTIRILLLDADADRPHPIIAALLEHAIEWVSARSDDPDMGLRSHGSVDAVLLEADGAGSDVLQACARLRQCAGNALLPIVILMSHADERFIEKACAAGATDCFPRTLSARRLSLRLSRLVDAARMQRDLTTFQQRAGRDALTGLLDRHGFITALRSAPAGTDPVDGMTAALVLIDIDRFKRFNDSLGPMAGDQVLSTCARRVRAIARAFPDALIGRVASDEFAIFLPRLPDSASAHRAAQRVMHQFSRPVSCGGLECMMTASVGLAHVTRCQPMTAERVDGLMAHAGMALSAAKAAGGHVVRAFEPGVASGRVSGLDLESRLHRAVERGELVLHYQPIIDPRTRRVTGLEALMRWQRDGQLVPPDGFIPLAEESGLIFPMGEWAIGEALAQLGAWRALGLAVPGVAVNIHPGHLARSALAHAVEHCMQASGLPASALQIELTETGVMRDIERSMESLHALRELGVQLALDDFGTGSSSLAYLTQLPVDTLKIDRSFVQRLDHDRQSHVVVRSIATLAQALGLSTVAEGVENAAQLDALRSFGCDTVQGYFFARPMPGGELAQWWSRFEHASRHCEPLLQPS